MTMIRPFFSAALVFGMLLLAVAGAIQAAERYKPFVLASRGLGDFEKKIEETRDALRMTGFEVLGEYMPYKDTFVDKAYVIVVTNDELKKTASMSQYGGFAAPWRIGITKVGDEIQIAYPNPVYIANAYRLNNDLNGVSETLRKALGAEETFNSAKGMTTKKLRKYHYTFGMEYFIDPYELAKYGSHAEAVAVLEKNLAAGVAGVTKVYRLDLPKDVTVFGVARRAPSEDGKDMDEQHIMSVVDFSELKGTAYLPYEIMVDGKKIIALHMRFRMALHYPDLKMVGENSFMNIMPSPNAIFKAFKAVAGAPET